MKRALFTLAGTAIAAVACGQTVIDNLAEPLTWTVGWLKGAQVMQAPEAVLDNFWFLMSPNTTVGTVQFRVETEEAGQPTGSVLFSSTSAVPSGGGLIQFNNLNVGLTAGTHYAFVIDLLGSSGESFACTEDTIPGSGWWFNSSTWFNFPNLDIALHASFVPEPGTLLPLGGGMLGLAVLRLRKSRGTNPIL